MYVDELGDVGAAGCAEDKHEATQAAWNQLLARVGGDAALADYRQRVVQLPPHATVRWVVQRTSITEPRQVCAYSKHRTARAAVDALAGTTHHTYMVVAEVNA